MDVRWVVAADPAMKSIVARGEGPTAAARDYTVKVDVTGLLPSTTYYYRFEIDGARSPTGRTRTLAAGAATRVRLGVVSCSNYPFGYFNAYGALAKRPDLDAIVHLGDYIYEYANGGYGDGLPLGRVPSPDKEIVALADYRQRHAQYKTDPDLQEVHRQHPFIVVWDDHELTNNAWHGGAENHNPAEGEGDWFVRRNAAVQAFFEWMPIQGGCACAQPAHLPYPQLRGSDGPGLARYATRGPRRTGGVAPGRRGDRCAVAVAARHCAGGVAARRTGRIEAPGHDVAMLGQQVLFAPQSERGQAVEKS